LPKR